MTRGAALLLDEYLAALEAVRWGAGAVALVGRVGYLKLRFWLRTESNRVLRKVKRLELQTACASAR